MLIQENVQLAPLTTLKVGGAARFFAKAETEKDVVRAVAWAKDSDLPLFILGGGSNVLISDTGFDGLVLQIALRGIEVQKNFATAQAGEDWDAFCRFCVEKSLAGVECLSGIPGFVGATPVQNVGAYGQEVSGTIERVRVFDRKTNENLELTNADCKFSYRASIFNTTEKNRFIVLAVTFALKKDGAPKIVYKDLINFFAAKKSNDKEPTLRDVREAVLEIRRAKSMVINKNDVNSRSVGSFFKNPIVTREKFVEVERCAKLLGIENVPNFAAGEKHFKIPAAWLIEKSGFYKGFRFGNVGISENHTLAIVNFGNAAAKDVLEFKEEIQSKVKEKFKIELKPEPVFVGFTENQ